MLRPSRRGGGVGDSSWYSLLWFLLLGVLAAAVPGRTVPSPAHSFISRAVRVVLGGLTPVASGVSLAVHLQGNQMSSLSVVQQSWAG